MLHLLDWLRAFFRRLLGVGGDGRKPPSIDPVMLLQQEMHSLRSDLDSRFGQLQTSMNTTQENIGTRLLQTSSTIGEVKQGLAKLEGATAKILEVGQGVRRLEELLKPPSLRGSLGEFLLEELIGQILPKDLYKMQHRFNSGETVDAIIRLPAGDLPVDAKFPLDAFRDMTTSQDEEEKRKRRRDFHNAVRRQVEDIAQKYIRPDEGTLELALMYIPAENVYYEIVLRDEDGLGLLDHSLKHRVFPVSPLSFYAHLQALAFGLRGLRIEQNARMVLETLSRLRSDIDSFEGDFNVLGSHVRNAYNKYQDAQQGLNTVARKLETIEQLPTTSQQPTLPSQGDS